VKATVPPVGTGETVALIVTGADEIALLVPSETVVVVATGSAQLGICQLHSVELKIN
jgi:hypothetical protein